MKGFLQFLSTNVVIVTINMLKITQSDFSQKKVLGEHVVNASYSPQVRRTGSCMVLWVPHAACAGPVRYGLQTLMNLVLGPRGPVRCSCGHSTWTCRVLRFIWPKNKLNKKLECSHVKPCGPVAWWDHEDRNGVKPKFPYGLFTQPGNESCECKNRTGSVGGCDWLLGWVDGLIGAVRTICS